MARKKWGSYSPSGGGGGSGLFLKLDDGESVEVMVHPDAEPHERFQRWDQAAGKYIDEDGPGQGISTRVLFPVFVVDQADMKIFEMAPSTWNDFTDALDDEKYGGVDQIYLIKRKGVRKDTRWTISRVDRATPERVKQVAGHDLPDLAKYGRPVGTGPDTSEPAPSTQSSASDAPLDDEVPF